VPTRNINLTEHFDRFVEHQVSSGRYSNASEIVRDALRLLEEQEQERAAKLKALRQAAKQGFDEIDQGRGIVLKGKKAIRRLIGKIEAEVRAKAATKKRQGTA
jgi:antitoxin ParD1/3/4